MSGGVRCAWEALFDMIKQMRNVARMERKARWQRSHARLYMHLVTANIVQCPKGTLIVTETKRLLESLQFKTSVKQQKCQSNPARTASHHDRPGWTGLQAKQVVPSDVPSSVVTKRLCAIVVRFTIHSSHFECTCLFVAQVKAALDCCSTHSMHVTVGRLWVQHDRIHYILFLLVYCWVS